MTEKQQHTYSHPELVSGSQAAKRRYRVKPGMTEKQQHTYSHPEFISGSQAAKRRSRIKSGMTEERATYIVILNLFQHLRQQKKILVKPWLTIVN